MTKTVEIYLELEPEIPDTDHPGAGAGGDPGLLGRHAHGRGQPVPEAQPEAEGVTLTGPEPWVPAHDVAEATRTPCGPHSRSGLLLQILHLVQKDPNTIEFRHWQYP